MYIVRKEIHTHGLALDQAWTYLSAKERPTWSTMCTTREDGYKNDNKSNSMRKKRGGWRWKKMQTKSTASVNVLESVRVLRIRIVWNGMRTISRNSIDMTLSNIRIRQSSRCHDCSLFCFESLVKPRARCLFIFRLMVRLGESIDNCRSISDTYMQKGRIKEVLLSLQLHK